MLAPLPVQLHGPQGWNVIDSTLSLTLSSHLSPLSAEAQSGPPLLSPLVPALACSFPLLSR